ncbi:MAG: peptidylprolyl isomerase [Verrucomicrobiota bacterium]
MQITSGKVVSMDYTLTDDSGKTLDSSDGGEPLTYLHGNDQIVFGLEKALNGKKVGDSFQVKVEPAEGYGVRDETKLMTIPRAKVQGVPNLKEGLQLQSGQQVVTVTKIAGDEVTLDANHPLAGETLNFAVTVRAVRAATAEEISHGHVHGPGGHHH